MLGGENMKKFFIVTILVLRAVLCLGDYKEINTNYFKVIYNNNISEKVKLFAENADKNAEKVFEFYNFKPEKKYNIIFKDNSDNDNGVTEYDTIKLYYNQIPVFYIEKNYEVWIDYLFVHELTHLIINQKSGGAIGKSFILKPVLHQMFIPAWYQEGLAVYTESKLFEGGRGNSPRFKMQINAAINEGKFEGLEFAGNYKINGNNSYIYGYSFIEYFAEVYGEEELKKSVETFSKHQIKGPFYEAAGKKRDELIKEWKEWTKKKYKPGEGKKEGELFSKIYGDKRNLKLSNGKLYFYSDKMAKKEKDEKINGIFSLDIKTNKIKKEKGIKITEGFEVIDEEIYYSTIIPNFIKGELRAESYKKNNNGDEHQEIKKAVNFFKMGGKIGAVIREKGRERVVTIEGEEIISSEYGFKFENFNCADDKLYFSASVEFEKENYIYCYDIKDKSIKKITEGYSPCFYKNNLYYSKNYKGIYNIFRIIIDNGKIERITDVKYGAFEPVIDENGDIYYLNYGADGYFINKITEWNSLSIEKNIKTVNKKNENISKNELDEGNKYKFKKFRDRISFRNGFITNSNIILNFSNTFNEKKLMLISGNILYAGQKFENYGIYSEEKESKLGIAALYIHSNGGMPLMILYGEKVDGEDGYVSGTFNIPYFNKSSKILLIGDMQFDSYGKKSAGISLFGVAGYRAEIENKVLKNELYLKMEKLKLNYYLADKKSIFEDNLIEGITYNFNSSFKTIGYRFKTDEALVIRGDTGYTFKINKATNTGRTVINSVRAASENIYAVWNNNGEREDILGMNLYIESSCYFNYNLQSKVRIGIMEYYDIESNKILSDKEIPYFNISVGF